MEGRAARSSWENENVHLQIHHKAEMGVSSKIQSMILNCNLESRFHQDIDICVLSNSTDLCFSSLLTLHSHWGDQLHPRLKLTLIDGISSHLVIPKPISSDAADLSTQARGILETDQLAL